MITVVVPTHDRPDLLDVALRSLCDQDYPHDAYEILVVEDGGSRRTAEVVRSYASRDDGPSVRYLEGPRAGVNAARNRGLAEAVGDPIVFTDDDIEAPSGWLSALTAGANRHPTAGCFGGPVRIRYEGRAPKLCGRHSLGKGEIDLDRDEGPLAKRNLLGANLVARRSALDRAGGFDERVSCGSGADSEWQTRLRSSGGTVVYVPDAWIWHRRTPDMLRLYRLLWQRFWRALNSTLYLTLADRRPDLKDQLRWIKRHVSHAYHYRCVAGLLLAANCAGNVIGLSLDKVRIHPGTRRVRPAEEAYDPAAEIDSTVPEERPPSGP